MTSSAPFIEVRRSQVRPAAVVPGEAREACGEIRAAGPGPGPPGPGAGVPALGTRSKVLGIGVLCISQMAAHCTNVGYPQVWVPELIWTKYHSVLAV